MVLKAVRLSEKAITMTIHETVVVRTLVRGLALLVFKCTGWKAQGCKPDLLRYVIIAAPHTSNWDFIFTLCLAFIYRLNAVIMMKEAWFRWPLGPLFRWLGALPIDRSRANHVVGQSIETFHQRDRLVLVVPPSGTRQRVLYWKTGFYHIAKGAGVPIVLGFLDYRRKVGGFGPTLQPTGDIDTDMTVIRTFYRNISGKYPLKESQLCIAPSVSPPAAG
jgi:1-acyl-sn-glycerol-3-phosphate acyltransferase